MNQIDRNSINFCGGKSDIQYENIYKMMKIIDKELNTGLYEFAISGSVFQFLQDMIDGSTSLKEGREDQASAEDDSHELHQVKGQIEQRLSTEVKEQYENIVRKLMLTCKVFARMRPHQKLLVIQQL